MPDTAITVLGLFLVIIFASIAALIIYVSTVARRFETLRGELRKELESALRQLDARWERSQESYRRQMAEDITNRETKLQVTMNARVEDFSHALLERFDLLENDIRKLRIATGGPR